jgi:hypothetical protein
LKISRRSKDSTYTDPSSAVGAPDFNAGGHPRPNNPFQRTLTPAGFGPLNSNRWRGASRLANGPRVDERPVAGASAGQQVVRADHRFLASHASVLRSVSSAAQLPVR